ncbi:M48 family metalloprotease [Exilibacterium tricleocarpae]|uniref:M48 family metalloprotease n=1 Tax=Exilibacterium tricleocarpae TaxID=2591008 RepID=A0A545U5A0_9GAMM|nr:M48 family metalloprotease [Exilibacterium tricleocarpae]TQV84637.1 M48 family metalloprotease [Exilibacterium tricleocarpae]
MSEAQEIKIGKEMHEKILETTPIYQDEALQAYVDSIGQKVAANSDRPDLKYYFTIIDEPNINAFALPGGYIYINRGLMGYLNSEAQLAAVLAHEVGHVTARHTVRQKTAAAGAGVLSVLSVLATGSTVVGDVTNLWSSAAVVGYGREMELEADGFGAQYLYNSGYDPNAMAEVIGVLKDQEKYARRKAREEGREIRTYHGVFSTHPRNDKRLKEVIAKAGTLPESEQAVTNEDVFREKINGLVYGINVQPVAGKPGDSNRYTHNKLGFTLVFPEAWKVENTRTAIIGAPEDKSAELRLGVGRVQAQTRPDQYIRDTMGIPLLTQSEPFAQAGLIGHMGIRPADSKHPHPSRIAVLLQGSRAYTFEGLVTEPQEDVNYDTLFVDAIRTFRPARSVRNRPTKVRKIEYVRANQSTTYAALAKYIGMGNQGEQQLRLLNGHYPRGEPKPGDWIKIVR